MEDVLAIRDEYRLKEWSQIIQAGQNSGLSKREFCKQNGISERQYYYWLKKVRLHTLDSMPVLSEKLPEKPVESPLVFKPLEVTSPVAGMRASVIVHLPQASIEVPDGVSQHTVEAVLLALKATC